MKLNETYDEVNKLKSTTMAALVSIIAIVGIIIAVLFVNKNKILPKKEAASVETDVASSLIETIPEANSSSYESTGLTVADLDFYDMYKNQSIESEETDSSVEPVATTNPEEVLTDATDGKHTFVVDYDGTTEWTVISPYLSKHNYDFTNLVSSNGKMRYYEDGRCVSSFGIDISKENDYIDFNKLQKAGCDFVMIRVGARGYESGTITMDDYFKDNLKRATDAGLDVGVYFLSQAVTEDEAIEEANFLLDSIGDYTLTYPVAFVMKYAKNDKSRIDSLSKNSKSMIARAFLNTIKNAGLKAVVYGDKAWLIKHVDMSKLISDYDIWYSQTDNNVPDYPYKFSMWQYDKMGTIDGVSGYVNFNLSFVDYSLK